MRLEGWRLRPDDPVFAASDAFHDEAGAVVDLAAFVEIVGRCLLGF
jgi:hypothetical protein